MAQLENQIGSGSNTMLASLDSGNGTLEQNVHIDANFPNVQSSKEIEDAIKNCNHVNCDFHLIDLSKEYNNFVFEDFKNQYLNGLTPNPCVECNKKIKFGLLPKKAKELGINFDKFATGHYARNEFNEVTGRWELKKGINEKKDQTYFLCQLSNYQLSKALFPLGELTKEQVRQIAKDNGLISSSVKDSYDICFLGSQKFRDFMRENNFEKEGDIIDIVSNKIVGKHTGLSKYTIGQRRGLGVGGGHGVTGESWYVVDKDLINNKLMVAQGDGEELLSSALVSNAVNWIPQKPNQKEFDCYAKFRYRQPDQKVRVTLRDDGSVYVAFQERQRAVTTGQYVVFYDGDNCLGGGAIDKVLK